MLYLGNPVSGGFAIGEAFLYVPFKPIIEPKTIHQLKVDEEMERYEGIKHKAKQELLVIRDNLAHSHPDKAKIFQAHIEILFDVALDEEIRQSIQYNFMSPECAIEQVYETFATILGQSNNELIRERATDLRDVKVRLLRNWFGVSEKSLDSLNQPVIVVAHDLYPSDTATLNREKVLAIVTEIGGATSHTAIIARSYEIPALLGVKNATRLIADHEKIIVDAMEGKLFTQPDDVQTAIYTTKRLKHTASLKEFKKFRSVIPVTKDGVRVDVALNIESASPGELEGYDCTDGVGLFRTEFLYMGKSELPTEEEQYEIYSSVLSLYGNRPVILRTLDIGGDKKLTSLQLPEEENPFLGMRAVRLCFEHMAMFKTQLRGAFRASVNGNLWIMFPMIGSIDDIRRCKSIVREVQAELEQEGKPYSKDVKIGIMVEIPSIAVVSDMAAREVDFASIGTNDLCQYLTAADRMNPSVSKYYQSYHPAMFRVINQVAQAFIAQNKPVSVCGEMGGDVKAATVLIGLGFNKLSMGLSSVAQIKKLITSITAGKAKTIAQKVMTLSTAQEVEDYINSQLEAMI